ncbi:MAG: hypothetical protein JJT96_10665 [Opitutales bacterium]|nr:hypothetical protein [Opitutales bacterium]
MSFPKKTGSFSPPRPFTWVALLATAYLSAVVALPALVPPPPPPTTGPAPILQSRVATGQTVAILRVHTIPAGAIYAELSEPEIVSTWQEPADNLDYVTVQTSGQYNNIASGPHIEGTGAFHLAKPDPNAAEIITLHPSFAVEADTRLFFESRLGWASPDQFARVEVSTDGGTTWNVLWSRAGTGGSGQGAFSRVELSLEDYAGQIIRLRFNYVLQGGRYFPQTVFIAGWLIDDIQISPSLLIQPELYSIGDPTALEQQMLEVINRARADAMAEAMRLRNTDDPEVLNAIAFFDVDLDFMEDQFAKLPRHLPPLAPNVRLAEVARLHSLDMLQNDFQGHDSSANPPPPLTPGATLGERLALKNYESIAASENVFAYARSVWHGHAGFNIDWGDTGSGSVGGMQNPSGHRINIHSPDFREIGMGLIEGSADEVGPLIVTQKFGTESGRDQPFITGVAWVDANENGVYDPGEGIGGIVVTVEGERFYAVTATAGGYAIPVSGNGSYTVTFTDDVFPTRTEVVSVRNGENLKLDFRPDLPPSESAAPTIEFFGRAPEYPNHWKLSVGRGGLSPVLQMSTDAQTWTDLPISSLPADDGTHTFLIPANDIHVQFFRILQR